MVNFYQASSYLDATHILIEQLTSDRKAWLAAAAV
jgi:hypothetical protein